jgi:hypothetical protein
MQLVNRCLAVAACCVFGDAQRRAVGPKHTVAAVLAPLPLARAGKADAVEVKEGRGGLPTVFLKSDNGATAEVRRCCVSCSAWHSCQHVSTASMPAGRPADPASLCAAVGSCHHTPCPHTYHVCLRCV